MKSKKVVEVKKSRDWYYPLMVHDFGTGLMFDMAALFVCVAIDALVVYFGWNLRVTPVRWFARTVVTLIGLLLFQHLVVSFWKKWKIFDALSRSSRPLY